MKKIVIIFIAALLLGTVYILKNKIGDVRPAVLPPKTTPSLQLKTISFKDLRVYAQDLKGIRDLEFSPDGTLLASLTSEGKIIALKNNVAKDILTGLNRPHGITFFQGKLFVAEETKVTRYNWDGNNLSASAEKILFNLPIGGNHFTRSLVFDKNGNLYVSVGSTCNVCIEKDEKYAAVLVSDAQGNNPRVFAKGLRNAVFLTLNPKSGDIWVTEMGRDFLGDNLPPDEINILKEGDYGWPNCYGNKIPDTNFNSSANCSNTETPIFEIPAHSAPLGLTFDPEGNLLVAYHGSWNRSVPDGYKVVKMTVEENKQSLRSSDDDLKITKVEDFITGFISDSEATGRPVDLIFDKEGNLYLSDDKAGVVYIVTKD